ncbi:MAG: ABC transporter permease [Actinomycetales bacterium]|nr:MAG: ABC transporter permease [Actinomycetales bacterium]
MFAYISRRLAVSLLILLTVSFAVYVIFAFLPFDPAALTCGKNCNDPGIIEANRHRLGYDLPFFTQYFLFLKGLLFGRSFGEGAALINCPAPSLGYSFQQHACVTNLIGEALPVTFSLAIGAIVMWLALGIGLGILAARFRGRIVDQLSTIFVLIGTSLPTFLTGLLLLVFVVIRWHLIPFPSGNYTPFFENPFEWAQILFLPWLTLAFAYAALYTRFVRSSVIDTSNEDYIRTARAKGLSEGVILGKHTLRAALAPIATMAGLDFAGLLGGAILTESVFNLPGLGRLAISAVVKYDLPIIVATTLLAAAIVVVMNLIVDILYAYIDPRVRVA